MSSFKVGDKVKISDSADHVELGIPRRMRAIVGTVIEVDRGAIDVRFPGLSDIYEFHATDLDMVESKSLSTTESHVKALRQKYGVKAVGKDGYTMIRNAANQYWDGDNWGPRGQGSRYHNDADSYRALKDASKTDRTAVVISF
jgi:hypothetical protein